MLYSVQDTINAIIANPFKHIRKTNWDVSFNIKQREMQSYIKSWKLPGGVMNVAGGLINVYVISPTIASFALESVHTLFWIDTKDIIKLEEIDTNRLVVDADDLWYLVSRGAGDKKTQQIGKKYSKE